MDVSYWIFILIAYLVSQWLKKRSQVSHQTTEEEESESSTPIKSEKEVMPKFLRNFGIDDLFDEIKSEIVPNKEFYDELSEKELEKTVESDDEIEFFDDDYIIEPELSKVGSFEKEIINEPLKTDVSDLKRMVSHPIQAYLNGSEGLKNAILIKEILGPPRAIERCSFRLFH